MFRSTFILSTRLASVSLARTPALARTPVLAAAVAVRSNAFAQYGGLRSFSGVTADDEKEWGFKLYPREVKISSWINFCNVRRAENKEAGDKTTLKKLGEEWSEKDVDAKKDEFPETFETKEAPKIKSEIYPRKVDVSKLDAFTEANEGMTKTEIKEAWAKLSKDEKAEYAVEPKMVDAEEGADFEHFFRLHKKAYMKKNDQVNDEEEARENMTEIWNGLTPEQQEGYVL